MDTVETPKFAIWHPALSLLWLQASPPFHEILFCYISSLFTELTLVSNLKHLSTLYQECTVLSSPPSRRIISDNTSLWCFRFLQGFLTGKLLSFSYCRDDVEEAYISFYSQISTSSTSNVKHSVTSPKREICNLFSTQNFESRHSLYPNDICLIWMARLHPMLP